MSEQEFIPDIIESNYTMTAPNEPIPIHDGDFIITYNDKSVPVEGSIKFVWFPKAAIKVEATAKSFSGLYLTPHKTSVIVGNFKLGELHIYKTRYKIDPQILEVEGYIYDGFLGTDARKTISTKFNVINLRSLPGSPVKAVMDDNGYIMNRNRITLESEEVKIILDKVIHFADKLQALKEQGGFLILYNGELSFGDKKANHQKVTNVLLSLHYFISLLNGRTCGLLFREGLENQSILWKDYKTYISVPYENIWTAFPEISDFSINLLWNNFLQFWQNDKEKKYIKTLINWYEEVNSNSHYLQSRVILVQSALELLFNWLVVERLKAFNYDTNTSITAADKIRLLLFVVKASSEIPDNFTFFKAFCNKSENEKFDGPQGLVNIRNAYVHSQKNKLTTLSSLNNNIILDAVHLGIWYFELALLYILGYNEKYIDRSRTYKSSPVEVDVPWKK